MNDLPQTRLREPAPSTAHTHDHREIPNPWDVAWREARLLILFVALIVTTYMLFAVDAPKVPFERRQKDTVDTLVQQPITGPETNAVVMPPPDSPLVAPLDTPKVDTGTALNPSESDSARLAREKVYRDSVTKATAERRKQDSVANAMNRQAQLSQLMQQLGSAKEINTETAKRAYDLKAPVVWLDARPEREFIEGHIPGAQNFYGEQWNSRVPELLKYKDQQVIVYCGGGECELSHDLADGLRNVLQFKKVVVYTGGTAEWTKLPNYPWQK